METWLILAGLIIPFLGLAIACAPQAVMEYREMSEWIHSWNLDTPKWDEMP